MNGLLLGKLGAVLVVAGGSAGVTWAATGSGSDLITNAGPAAWIDDPLDGSVLPSEVSEVIVVAHATDPDGIVEVVLTVDGAEVDAADTGGDDLVTADDLRWTPRGPGTYELRVIGRDPGGATTPPGIAVVQVGTDEEQPTTTTTTGPADSTSSTEVTASTEVALESTTSTTAGRSTSTTRPVAGTTTTVTGSTAPTTPTTRPTTTTTCVPATARNLSPANGANVGTRTPTLEWAYEGCTPELFRIQISRDSMFLRTEEEGSVGGADARWVPPPLVCNQQLWFRVRAEVGSTPGSWSSPTSFTVALRVCA